MASVAFSVAPKAMIKCNKGDRQATKFLSCSALSLSASFCTNLIVYPVASFDEPEFVEFVVFFLNFKMGDHT